MKIVTSILILGACIIFYACSDDSPVKPKVPCDDITYCDTCDTYAELTGFQDSAAYYYPHADLTVRGLRKSPTGDLYAAGSFLDIGSNRTWVFHLGDFQPKMIGGGTWVEWSNRGEKVLIWYGIYNAETGTLSRILPEFSEDIIYPTWSLDDSWIYFTKNANAYKFRPDTSYLTFICDSMGVTRQANDSTLVSFYDNMLCTFNLNTRFYKRLQFSRLPSNLELMTAKFVEWNLFLRSDDGCWDISPDGTKILADFRDVRGPLYRENSGLYLFDLENETVTMVLPGQYWGQPYYPRWASNESFYASYFCRKDRLSMVYEFGLDGKTKKQMTFATQKFW